MIPLVQLKKDLAYSEGLRDTIDILKMIASSEFHNLTTRMEKHDLLHDQIVNCFGVLRAVPRNNPFFVERKGVAKAYLLVCSDEGFLGEVNTHIANAALSRGADTGGKFIVLGERGARILRDAEVKFTSFPSISNEMKMDYIIKIADYIMELYKTKTISALHVIYMKFVSFTNHHLDIVKLLPCDELVKYLKEEKEEDALKTLIEPHPYYVLEYLVKLWVVNNLYNIFWSGKLSEWSIRVMHLEHSSDELKDINRDLKFKYFKSVHALNDKVIREIFAARTLI